MKNVNLIPVSERRAKQTRRHIRQWVVICIAYAAALLVVTALCHAALQPPGDVVRQDLERTLERARQSHERIQQLAGELTEVQSKLAASRAVGRQPDWSVLLGVLAEKMGEQVVLRSCSIEPAPPPGPVVASGKPVRQPDGEHGYVVVLEGLGRSQAAVSSFVLRLEQTGLFGRVQQQGTSREKFLSDTAVRFALRCNLAGQGGP